YEFYVYDEEGVLSSDTKQFIIDVNKQYEQTKEKPQIVVAVVPSLQGIPIEEYTVKLFEKWKIGNQTEDNGVLILLSTQDREIRFEVGYGLEGALTDSGTGRILDRHLDLLSNDQYDEGLKNVFTDTAVTVNEEYEFDNDTIVSGQPVETYEEETSDGLFSIFQLLLVI